MELSENFFGNIVEIACAAESSRSRSRSPPAGDLPEPASQEWDGAHMRFSTRHSTSTGPAPRDQGLLRRKV